MKQYTSKDHTFIVCAYRESPYLEECIQSLLRQTALGEVVVVTSTDCEYIHHIVDHYHLPLFVNRGEAGIAGDWNFGYTQAKTPLVTIAHQDDIYEPEYVERLINLINRSKHPLIAFSDYSELREGKRVDSNQLLRVKRILLSPLKVKIMQRSKFVRRRSLSLGNGICCPSVMFVRPNLPDLIFQSGYRSNLDWQAWERLSKENGEFLYYAKQLMLHRIHSDSETSHILADNRRQIEDLEMFCKFWPLPIAKVLEKVYRNAEKSNQIKHDQSPRAKRKGK